MEHITRKIIDDCGPAAKVITVNRAVVGWPGENCWEIETRYNNGVVGRLHVRPEKRYDHDLPLHLDAGPIEVARYALNRHGNDYFSASQPVRLVIVEHPTIAGVVTVVDPSARPSSTTVPPLADSGRRESVLA